MKKKTKTSKPKDFYAFGKYKPGKNAVPVTYKGTEYLSKAQCMALEGITRKELDAYLATPVVESPVDEVTEELPEDYFDVDDDL